MTAVDGLDAGLVVTTDADMAMTCGSDLGGTSIAANSKVNRLAECLKLPDGQAKLLRSIPRLKQKSRPLLGRPLQDG